MLSFQLKTGKDETWFYVPNMLHRRGAKALKMYWGNGKLRRYSRHINGMSHNPQGPAHMYYYESGSTESEHHFVKGLRHSTDLAAYMVWLENGEQEIEWFYLLSNKLTKSEWEEQRCSVSN